MRPVVLLTGSAQRLGRVMALALARAGWDLALHYYRSHDAALRLQEELALLGAESLLLGADLAQIEPCTRLVRDCAAWAGARWQALVNNASRFAPDAAADADVAAWHSHGDINARAPWLLAQGLYAHVCAQADQAALAERAALQTTAPPVLTTARPRGCVINILDQKVFNLNRDYFSYTMSKIMLEGLTRMLALSLAPQLRVCGLAPGITLPSGPQDAANFARAHRQTPLGQSSTAADVAEALVWLLQAQAVHGSTLLVDGGQHLWPLARDVMFEV